MNAPHARQVWWCDCLIDRNDYNQVNTSNSRSKNISVRTSQTNPTPDNIIGDVQAYLCENWVLCLAAAIMCVMAALSACALSCWAVSFTSWAFSRSFSSFWIKEINNSLFMWIVWAFNFVRNWLKRKSRIYIFILQHHQSSMLNYNKSEWRVSFWS